MFGLLISLWRQANSLFVCDKYVTLTGNRLHAGKVQNRKHVKTYHLTPQISVNNTCVWFNDELTHNTITSLTPQFTFISNFMWSKRNLYIQYFDTTEDDLSFILGVK